MMMRTLLFVLWLIGALLVLLLLRNPRAGTPPLSGDHA